MRVAIAGFGTVGRSVAKILCTRPPTGIVLSHIYNRNIQRKVEPWIPSPVRWTEQVDDLFGPDVDAVVELLGGVDPAEALIRRALTAGKAVVTANKQVVARSGPELIALACQQGQPFRFEASVAAGIPILCAVEEGLVADVLSHIRGVLNGTCNFILSRMEEAGVSFADALAEAQRRGYAEANPTDDIDGFDARAKLSILSMVGMRCRVRPEDIPTWSISGIEAVDFACARQVDSTIRQVSVAENNPQQNRTIAAWVGPALVPRLSPIGQSRGPNNVITVRGEFGGETTFSGPGAGGAPTAVAVVSDLIAIARGAGGVNSVGSAATICPVRGDYVGSHYVRLTLKDRLHATPALSTAWTRHGVETTAILAVPDSADARVFQIVTLGVSSRSAVDRALEEIEQLGVNVSPPLVLPILGDS